MAAPTEVLLTTESSGQLWNICAWNPTTGASLTTFKGSASSAKTLGLIGDDYVLSADNNKPLINVWSIGRQDHALTRIVCTGKVTALAVSRDGAYCVGAIDGKLHVWQVSTGNLLVVLGGHYLKVSCIKFTDDGSYFVSGSDDGLVLVWFTSSVLSRNVSQAHNGRGIEPRHIWSQHSSAVTDIHVGLGGPAARIATASIDKSVKLWQLSSGELIETFVFDSPVSSVILDHAETVLFAGASDGNIYLVDFMPQLKPFIGGLSKQKPSSALDRSVLKGHRSIVTCLSISLSCETLASGSADGTVILWNLYSRDCMETIKHKGPVTNCLLVLMPMNLLQPVDNVPIVPFTAFKRHMYEHRPSGFDCGQDSGDSISVRLFPLQTLSKHSRHWVLHEEEVVDAIESKRAKCSDENSPDDSRTDAQTELARAKQINKKLYQFAVDKLLKAT